MRSKRSGYHWFIIGFYLISILAGMAACKSSKDVSAEPIQISPEIQALSAAIAKANYIGTEQTNRKPGMDPAFADRLKLMRTASEDELLSLSGDTNAVVALTAFEGLYKRGNKLVPIIFSGYMERSDIIQYIKGDIAEMMPMLEYAYVNVMHYQIPNEEFPYEVESGKPKFELSTDEQNEVFLKIAELRAEEVNPDR